MNIQQGELDKDGNKPVFDKDGNKILYVEKEDHTKFWIFVNALRKSGGKLGPILSHLNVHHPLVEDLLKVDTLFNQYMYRLSILVDKISSIEIGQLSKPCPVGSFHVSLKVVPGDLKVGSYVSIGADPARPVSVIQGNTITFSGGGSAKSWPVNTSVTMEKENPDVPDDMHIGFVQHLLSLGEDIVAEIIVGKGEPLKNKKNAKFYDPSTGKPLQFLFSENGQPKEWVQFIPLELEKRKEVSQNIE